MTDPLTLRGYRLIAPSRAGYLRSDMPEVFTVERQAAVYAELLDRLEIDRAVIVAISAGAWSAVAFAARYPDRCRALVLIAPATPLPPGTKNYGGWVAGAMFRSDLLAWIGIQLSHIFPRALARIMLGTDPELVARASPEERHRVQQILDHLLPMEARWPGMRFDIATAAHPEEPNLAAIHCPVLAISDHDDCFGTELQARKIVEGVRDGQLVVYPSGGHAFVERQLQVFDAVDRFLGAR